MDELQQKIVDYVEANGKTYQQIALEIHEKPEVSNYEFFASKRLADQIKSVGFEVEMPAAGHRTGFAASYKSGKPGPVMVFLAEYDALVGLGHGCGHNLFGATSSLAAAALKSVIDEVGGEVRLYTRMQVREDAMTLFGFSSKDERTMFDRLVSVSGVGPRLALAVLSTYTVGQLYSLVMAEDDKGMAKVPGVGKKTAQRLILELKSTFAKDKGFVPVDAIPGQVAMPVPAAAPSAIDDARAALLSMGFSPQETDVALSGYDGQDMRVEDLLGAALKRLGMDA